MQIRTILITIYTLFIITSCTTYDLSRPLVQQGNLLPESKIKQLRIGMSKKEAAIIMGTSLLSPTFNNERWDYAYTIRKKGAALKKRILVIYFANNKIIRIEHHRF